jgi:Xaa-Pro aminopeptidase
LTSRQELANRGRIERLRFAFSALRADAFLVTHLPNILYLSGFTGSAGLLLVEREGCVLFTDSRYTLEAQEEVEEARVDTAKRGLVRAAGERIRALSRHRRITVGYAPSQMTVAQKAAIEKHAGRKLSWVPADNLVERLRTVKEADELRRMRAAAELISRVFQQTLKVLRPGVRETDVAAELEMRMKRAGAAGPSFETIVACGPRSAWPHARPSSNRLSKSELVVLDQGAILRSYCSDMTRTVYLGRPPRKIREMYRAVLEAQAAAKAVVEPGVRAEKVDLAARRVLKSYGLEKFFTHSTGHGLGLEVHEIPRIGRGDRTVLQTGMVLTIEPGIYIEGLGGIRIEDDVVVAGHGAQDLTTAPREFLEL